jgi:hypothetical protein
MSLRWIDLAVASAALLLVLGVIFPAWSADPEEGKVAGLLFDVKDNRFLVKADGEDEPVEYFLDPANKSLKESAKGIFNAARVQLTYKTDGGKRQLIAIKKQVLKQSGTVTGSVVKVHNDFWVEVKPKTGPADAYSPGVDTFNDKAFMERLKGLQPGDSVTITFYTDFERHRIKSLRVNPPEAKK